MVWRTWLWPLWLVDLAFADLNSVTLALAALALVALASVAPAVVTLAPAAQVVSRRVCLFPRLLFLLEALLRFVLVLRLTPRDVARLTCRPIP